ncbi:MAG: hypothetical protein LKF31_02920 [Muribaculaceae bacterium]|nr:hypothetical protein [Muribaculaceae bacterium]
MIEPNSLHNMHDAGRKIQVNSSKLCNFVSDWCLDTKTARNALKSQYIAKVFTVRWCTQLYKVLA